VQYLFVNVGCNNELRRIEQLSLEFWITSKKATKSQQILIRLKKKTIFELFNKIVYVFGKNKIGMFPHK
jgi:hypothetical protein